MSITKENASIENLSEVPYGELMATFAELGVPSAWKPGGKKEDMIQACLEKLTLIKSMQTDGKTEEEAQEGLKEKEDEIEEVKETKEKEEAKKAEDIRAEKEAKLRETKLSKEDLEATIAKLRRASSNCINSHRDHLISKLQAYEKMLEDGHYTE